MAQTGYTPISIYYSSTASNTPTAGNLVAGELAINTADGKLFYKDSAGAVQVIGTKGGVGSSTNTQVLYNSSGLVVGSANMTFNGTTLTLANDASISGLTVGKGGGGLSGNTALGIGALAGTNTSTYNTAIGQYALNNNTSGTENTAVGTVANGYGNGALVSNTTGSYNSAFGNNALGSNTTGASNVGLGWNALKSNTTSSYQTAVGYQAGYNTTGNGNCFFGYLSGLSNTTGVFNAFFGRATGAGITTGYFNTIIGDNAGVGFTTGSVTNNTFLGASSGNAITSGSNNTIIGCYTGNQGGLDIRTTNNYIVLSDGNGNPRQIIDNYGIAYFENNASGANIAATNGGTVILGPTATASPRVVIGHASGSASGTVYQAYNYAGTTIGTITQAGTTGVLYNVTSDYRLKTDATPIQNALATVEALNPVSFTWVDGRKDDGFLAHEIQAVIPNCVTGEKDAVDKDGKPIYQQMDNSGVIPFLVKAIQELKAEFDAYKATHP